MIKKFILIFIIFLISTTSAQSEVFKGYLTTRDGVKIGLNQYKTGHHEVLIIAPGWFMSKDSKAFTQMSNDFSKYYDVINFDFRGHCTSSGKYAFGRDETKDLAVIVNYAAQQYDKVYLIGFSLGSLISVDYCSKNFKVDKLILVSAPVSFNKIENHILSPNAFIPTLKKFEFKRWTSIKFCLNRDKKPSPLELIDKINEIPVFFIAGEDDPIINCWHNEKLFLASKGNKQKWVIKDGKHAEDLYLENRDEFIKKCVMWLETGDVK